MIKKCGIYSRILSWNITKSTIRNCDRILVLNNGTIAEEGNYEELMAKHGLFYQLASRQIAE